MSAQGTKGKFVPRFGADFDFERNTTLGRAWPLPFSGRRLGEPREWKEHILQFPFRIFHHEPWKSSDFLL